MKKLLLPSLFIYSFLCVSSTSYAALDINCSDSWSLFALSNPYENIYHNEVSVKLTRILLEWCYYRNEYSKNSMKYADIPVADNTIFHDAHLMQIFPIYHPKQKLPILLQTVSNWKWEYWNMVSVTPSTLFWSMERCQWIRFPDRWLNEVCGKWYAWTERKTLYYLSQAEPYKSSPQIQFYVYKLGILLVARDNTWRVTHWNYERKSLSITESQIRSFLWPKWYHP